jgi:hypothetical protein
LLHIFLWSKCPPEIRWHCRQPNSKTISERSVESYEAGTLITAQNLKWGVILRYTWKSMLYYVLLSVAVYLLHNYDRFHQLHLPFTTMTALSTALAILLSFKNNNAYERWGGKPA